MPKYLTTEDWIERFKALRGEELDYSKVRTKLQYDPVIIVCRVHGEFMQIPYWHLKSVTACPTCAKVQDWEELATKMLARFKEVHGDTFDYSKFVYAGRTAQGTIGCPSHGFFTTTPAIHLRSPKGCPRCSVQARPRGPITRSTLSPVERFTHVHGDKYDYSEVVYKGLQTNVTIKCRDHGYFYKTPSVHLRGAGCSECSPRSIDKEECLRRFKAKHGDKFDYSKVDFVSSKVAVTVVCPSHGEFSVQPVNHWKSKEGCRWCAGEKKRKVAAEKVVARFITVHGDRYAYGNFVYEDMHSLSLVTCKQHGDFPISPANHLSDHGCPSCWQNTASKPETAWGVAIADATGWELEQATKVNGVPSVIDFIVTDSQFGKLAIEYDGHYWHSGPEMMERDTQKTQQLLDAGHKVVRLRSDEGRLAPLPPVPGAINIWVPAYPDDESVKLAVKEIEFALGDHPTE